MTKNQQDEEVRLRTGALSWIVWSAVLISVLACGAPDPAPIPRDHPNLLLLTVDTLRSDHLSGYGYPRPTSPALDAFFESAVVFDDAHAASSWTLPSLASLLTSLHPSTHGCVNLKSRLAPSFRTLAEILRDAGYRTAGIASHKFLREAYGLQQGFDSFDDELPLNLRMSHLATSSPQVTQKVVDWLDLQSQTAEPRTPWFLWAHYFDPHFVYLERPQSSQFGTESGSEDPVDFYDGEIAFTDHQLGIVFERLAELDLVDSTVVVFTSDHGEAFGEHGHDQHGSNLFREVTQVPLAIRAPGFEPRRVSTPTGGVDVLPTVLALLGIDTNEGVDIASGELLSPHAGQSLVAAMRGQPLTHRPLLLETQVGRAFHVQAVIDDRWKLVADLTGALTRSETGVLTLRPRGSEPAEPAYYLFDREHDPNEQVDLSEVHPEITMRLQKQLDDLVARAELRGQRAGGRERDDLSDEEIDALRALGYLDDSDANMLRAEQAPERP